MCEFCHKHGEGKKWYLQAKNYSEDLYSDLARRKAFDMKELREDMKKMRELKKAPAIVKALRYPRIEARVKQTHYGQVLPIEDVEQIFGFVNSVVRIACVCRKERNVKEQRYCYGITVLPQWEKMQELIQQTSGGGGLLTGPDTSDSEKLTKEEALESFRKHEQEGLCHTVWTYLTPFIVGICNCDRSDCGAMQANLVNDTPIMFRAEYVAEVNLELCNGCRQCMRFCQFGAISYSAGSKKIWIDVTRCYGCGVCRASCTKDAIHLHDRASVPAAANLW